MPRSVRCGPSIKSGAARFSTIVGPEPWRGRGSQELVRCAPSHVPVPRCARLYCRRVGPAARDSPVYLCAYPPGSRPEDVPALVESARANQQQPPKTSFDVTFEVTGLHRATADTVTLTVAIVNRADRAEAQKLLLGCIRAVYKTIGRPVPPALPAYLEKEEHYLAHEPYGIVSLFTTSRHDSDQIFWFRLGRNH